MEHKTIGFSVKAAEGDGSTGDGIGNAFHNVDSYRDITAPGAFLIDMPLFLSDGFIGGLNHDWDNPIGKPTDAKEVAQGLYVAWAISDTAHGKDVKTLLKDGVIKKLSIGYQTLGYQMLQTADDVAAYWQAQGYQPSAQDIQRASEGNIRLLTRIRLYEVSPVTVPANDRSDITTVKSADLPATEREVEAALKNLGFSRREAQIVIASGYKALLRDSDEQKQGGDSSPALSSPAMQAYLRFVATETQLQEVLG